METATDFDYEIFLSIKNHVKGYVDDLVALIVADRNAGNGCIASFVDIADQIGVETTTEIFSDFLTTEELATCTQAWVTRRG
jgi:hypothetical protein